MSGVVDRVAARAADVLRENDRGGTTLAAPRLYPHQWSWDAAFISIGLTRLSVPRALTELANLLRGQWGTGMIPQIVFSGRDGYFPGPDRWRTAGAAASPAAVQTSGICQPPVHSVALYLICDQARRNGGDDARAATEFVRSTFDDWFRWHSWLSDVRDPAGRGLVEIHHGWESGMDNSPRWDAAYSRIRVGPMPPFVREDTKHVGDVAQRPSDEDYRRYLWLVEQLASVGYDDERTREVIDFRVADVFFSAVLALASDLLADLGEELGRVEQVRSLREMARRGRAGVTAAVSPTTGLAMDYDVRTGEWVATQTLGGFAPLVCGADPQTYTAQVDLLLGERWCGHPALRLPLPPTTSPMSGAFTPNNYWRGPQWPVTSWLLSWALEHHGHADAAATIRAAGLEQLSDLSFAEYYDATDGTALGSRHQSWTAAAALAWAGEATR
ncbi:glucosylglycerate hydrolase [Georgenia sp. H159]|uniref:glucosylglycerate hydrolase n=1 Tax=Georgenia sp. H159 TaxID=3076115 RepID=UPI002D78EC3E|nr:glycoside hydrolase 100 family protein [Georgenia sp. H159]